MTDNGGWTPISDDSGPSVQDTLNSPPNSGWEPVTTPLGKKQYAQIEQKRNGVTEDDVRAAAKKYGIPEDFAVNIAKQESGISQYDEHGNVITSKTGALGVMQLMPDTAKGLGVDPRDPHQNLNGGMRYLAQLYQEYHGDLMRTAAAYNAGPGAVSKFGGVPPYKETQAYVKSVLDGIAPAGAVIASGWEKIDKPLRSVSAALQPIADAPLKGVNAVLGAPQRFVAGALQADEQHGGLFKATPGQEFIGGIRGAFHPNDETLQPDAEHVVGADKLKTNDPDPTFMGKVRNAAVDFGFQTLTDPLTLVGGGGLLEAPGKAAIKGMSDAAQEGLVKGNKFAAASIPNPEARVLLGNGDRYNQYESIVGKHKTAQYEQENEDKALLAKYGYDLKKWLGSKAKGANTPGWTNVPDVPDFMRQRLLREAFVNGTPKMRTQALLEGYSPTMDEMLVPPKGILDYNVKHEYVPHTGQVEHPPELQVFGKDYKMKTPTVPFTKPQLGTHPKDYYKAMESRLQMGRAAVRFKGAQQELEQTLGIHPAISQGLLANSLTEGAPGLTALSHISRETMIALGIPHMLNVSALGYLSGGVTGVTKGLYYALADIPKSLRTRMEMSDALEHFGSQTPSKFSPARLVPGRQQMQQALDRVDTGMRAARWQQIERMYGKGTLSDLEIGKMVRDDLGNYKNSPAYVKVSKMLGGMFPQWHDYIVPTAVARAVLKHPERVEAIVRAEMTGNEDVLNSYGVEAEFGPVAEAASLAADPIRVMNVERPKYTMGPSTIGPIGMAMTQGDYQPRSFDPAGGLLEGVTQNLLPLSGVIGPQIGKLPGKTAQDIGNPFNSKAPPDMRSVMALFGIYPHNKITIYEKVTRGLMEGGGMDRTQAQNEAMKMIQAAERAMGMP